MAFNNKGSRNNCCVVRAALVGTCGVLSGYHSNSFPCRPFPSLLRSSPRPSFHLVPVHQLDRRRHHADEIGPLDRLEALAAARRDVILRAAETPSASPPRGFQHRTCRTGPTSAPPPRQVSPSSSLMPITPLPTPDRMLISSTAKWMTWPSTRGQVDGLLVVLPAPSPAPPGRLR